MEILLYILVLIWASRRRIYCRITLKVFNTAAVQIPKLVCQHHSKMGLIIRRSTHELDLDDQVSIRLYKKSQGNVLLSCPFLSVESPQYFKACWVPKIEMWLTTMRSLPLASQEASDAIEGYHLKLKLILSDDSHLRSLQRVDWRITLHHLHYRASQISENAVILDDKDRLFAISQKDTSQTHMVSNDCSWSLQGNLCKHVNLECSSIGEYFLKSGCIYWGVWVTFQRVSIGRIIYQVHGTTQMYHFW
ncbi:hypothetical protein MKW98_016277 [Papaver atlanticum]|uniref:Uncharacterized protein n=1 Tax=Papaver atlanticum TaxID=357466 RepID=A0AAD4SGX3_9MAGN|nr:hypothetical protein MKW98_016277 [Papaver atlanticum]